MATWTTEQILALAPDAASAKSGKDLSSVRKWVAAHRDDALGGAGALWGECQGSGKDPYRTQIDLAEPAFKCSCPSRKFPCKHGLGLFLLFAQNEAAFTAAEAPAWVKEWFESRATRAQKQAEKAEAKKEEVPDPKAQEKRIAAREKKVAGGVAELELWLRDLVRRGLANIAGNGPQFYEGMAARLVDAQAPGLARMVRELSGVALTGEGWQSRLIERLAKLHLLIEAFKRLETLPGATQADVRSLIGWTQNQDELMAREGERDEWLVLGRRVEEDERLRTARTWLWGRKSSSPALVLDFAPAGRSLELALAPGLFYDAELVFYPGAAPQRAVVKKRLATTKPALEWPGYASCANALEACATLKTRNPWMERFALPLQQVVPQRDGEKWFICDTRQTRLPLSPRFCAGEDIWKLLAHSGGRPLGLFGEWDGEGFWPLSLQGRSGLVAL